VKHEHVETWQVLALCFEPHVLTSHEAPSPSSGELNKKNIAKKFVSFGVDGVVLFQGIHIVVIMQI
jgi:hypothetical protein